MDIPLDKQAVLRRKNKDRWAGNPHNVFKWSDLSTYRLLFKRDSVALYKSIFSVLVWYKVDIIFISLNITCSGHDMADKLLTLLCTCLSEGLEDNWP
jgi:hypothetical protein